MRFYFSNWDLHINSYKIPICSYETPFSYLTAHICCSKTRCELWPDKISVVARQDVCCGKTRSLLRQDKISLVPRHSRIHKVARSAAPLCRSGAKCRLPYALPQERSCLATAGISSCHITHLLFPQQRSCLATTDMCCQYQNRDFSGTC